VYAANHLRFPLLSRNLIADVVVVCRLLSVAYLAGSQEEDFQALVEEIDEDGTRSLDLKEFKHTTTMLGLPLGKVARTKVRLQISVLVSVLWLFMGMFAIELIEGWSHVDSFYFSVMTLTTVGLGDFVPQSRSGTIFGFFYCMVGLGLIALLVTAIGDFSEAVKNKAERKAHAAVVAAAAKAALASDATRKSMKMGMSHIPVPHRSPSKAADMGVTAVVGDEEGELLVNRILKTKVDAEADERRQRAEEGGHGMIGRLTVEQGETLRMDGSVEPEKGEVEEQAEGIMDAFDRNHDGVLDASEVAAIARAANDVDD